MDEFCGKKIQEYKFVKTFGTFQRQIAIQTQ